MIEENWTVVFEHDATRQAAKVVMTEKGPKLGEEVVITPYD